VAEDVVAALDATDKDVGIGGAGLATASVELGLVDGLRMFRNSVVSGRLLRRFFAVVGLADVGEDRRIQVVRGSDSDSAGGDGAQCRRSLASLQEGAFAHDRAGSDLSDPFTVYLDVQDAVEQQEDCVTGGALLDEGFSRLKPLHPRPLTTSHDPLG
jgi:hypothetical protein